MRKEYWYYFNYCTVCSFKKNCNDNQAMLTACFVFFADYRYPATTGRGNQPIPGDITHFTPSINLPMKTLYMNPFPSAIDALLPNYQEPILITLKSSQKYFIHNQSYLPSDHAVAPAH